MTKEGIIELRKVKDLDSVRKMVEGRLPQLSLIHISEPLSQLGGEALSGCWVDIVRGILRSKLHHKAKLNNKGVIKFIHGASTMIPKY